MINVMKSTQNQVTDFNKGSVVRSLLGAFAAEMDELYQEMFIGLKEAIPVSIYQTFSFNPLPAVAASGNITVNITSQSSSVLIPAGSVFTFVNGSVSFVSQADVTIAAGNTSGSVYAVANLAGVVGNVPINTSFVMTPAVSSFVSASNPVAFNNGADQESADAQQQRFQAFITALQRGTLSAIQYGAMQAQLLDANGVVTERVATAAIVEPYLTDNTQPVGLVNVYLHNGTAPASSALIAQAQKIIYGYYDTNNNPVPGYKAAGVQVNVYAASTLTVNATAHITALTDYQSQVSTLATNAQNALSSYLQNLPLGGTAILAEMIAIVMNIPGVENVTFTAPTGDTTSNNTQKIMPGTLSVTY